MQRLGTVAKPLLLEFRNAWSRQIRALYSLQFMTKCPKSLHCLQSLSFLPHVLQIPAPWPILDIQTVANKCGIRSECFSQSRQFLAQALANSSEFSLLCAEVLKYRLEKKQDCCTALRHLTTWNVSGWRTLQWTNPKTQAILRRARHGIVCLQETRWTASTATNFLQTYPGFNIAHSPSIVTENGGLSGGVAILIPCSFRLLQEIVITPGKLLAAQVQTRTDCFWVISAYCHPSSAKEDCEALARWLTDHQDHPDPFFIVGDFNHGHHLSVDAWHRILSCAQGDDIVRDEPTFWGPNGSSSIDKVILPTEYMNRGLIQHQVFYDRFFESAGHACISIQLRHRPPVSSSPDLPLHMTIPASVFQPGKDRHDTRQVWPSLQSLVRRLCLVSQPTFESLQALLWQWWMSLPKRPRDFNTLRKHLQSDRPLLNISKRLLRELLAALPGFRPALEEYCQSSTVITVPRTFLWKCFELLDLQLQQQHLITRNRDETTRSRGLGTNAPLWQRLRASCPRTVFYNGPILDGAGNQCQTDLDLSAAMLATRKFWFQPPVKYDPEWTDYLEQYKAQAQPWPHVPPPGAEDLIRTVLATNDSSPGPDGIPYAAWRLHPGVSSDAMITHLNDICRSSVPPPCSVQAWIPKAKMGPTADNFRPLGMPSTFERVIDGSIATVMTRAIAPLLHPSQTVLNLFREPQSAVQSVQSVLDQDAPCACLSLDLSKAFERINPYWILQILSACKAPWWIIMYTRHILLFRRCRHKVQGKLLPSKMIVTGVDMGRSFSVLLFCVAMDPVLTYLNRIPGMLTVQGYVDDTTMVGDTTAGMQWLSDAWQACTRLKSAGIQIDEHHCWRTSGINMHAASSGQIDQYPPLQWTQSLPGHATLRQALVHRTGYSTTTIVCRAKLFVCLTPAEVDVVLAGGHLAKIDPLFLVQCSCSNKCSVLVNHPASQSTLNALECSSWGAHLIEGKTTALGLLLYGKYARSHQGWAPVEELIGTQAINPKAMSKANHRLALFATPAHSVVQRSLANNCFILSLNIYQSTYFGFNPDDINLYQQRSAKLILGRPWLAARYLPHIFRWLGIAPALDPAVTLTAACLGYWLRQNGSTAFLSPGYPDVGTRQGEVVQRIFRTWIPLLGLDTVGNLLRITAGQNTRRKHFQFLRQLKLSLYEAIQVHALQYLQSRVSLQLLPGGVSWAWLTHLATVPKLAVNGVARFAVLRWAVNEDDDECLRLRLAGSLQAEQPCQLCGIHTRLYPLGLNFAPACERCCHDHDINATTLYSSERWGIPATSPWHAIAESTRGSFPVPASWRDRARNLAPCVACRHGDNSSQHWARFCIVPVLVANVLSPSPNSVKSLDQLARVNTAGCVIASHILHQFRRLLLEHGGMQHAPSSVPLSVPEWLTRLHDNALQAIPTRFLPEPVSPVRPQRAGADNQNHPCYMQTAANEAVTLHSAALPDLVCTALTSIAPDQPIAVLPLGHPWLSLIAPARARVAGFRPNAKIVPACPNSPDSFCTITALQSVSPNELILAIPPDDTPSEPSIQIVGQFDGSCMREETLGGAGYVIYVIEGGRSRVIACRSVALPHCSDNIEAEIMACLYLVEEISVVVKQLLSSRGLTPKVVIQGDIPPVIKYFQFAGRLRRLDMHQPLESIRATVSLHLPCSLFIYLPRVANGIVDDLAGQASQFLLARYRSDPSTFNRNAGPVSIKPSFPTALFQVGGFHIQSFEQPWSQPILTLVERPSIDHGLLRKHVTLHPHHRQLIESYLSPCLPQNCSIEIDYSPKAADNHGRRYCCTIGGQRLPRAARLLLFGRNHCEIDLKGSFYELVRRLGLLFAPDLVPLPTIDELRAQLARDPYIQKVEAIYPDTIKQLPLRIINSSLDATYRHLRSLVDDSPSASVSAILRQLWSLSATLTTQLLPRFRLEFQASHNDSAFRLLEHFEAIIVEDTIHALIARHPTQSLVWLHDGFLVAPPAS